MRMRSLAALLFLTIGICGITDAAGRNKKRVKSPASTQPVSCDSIVHGTSEESFVQRISCARQAMAEGKAQKAYELMAPVYNHAKTKAGTARDSRDKLGAIVQVRLGKEYAQDVLAQNRVEDVYAAMAIVDTIDPSTGTKGIESKKIKSYALPRGLIDAVAKNMPEAGGAQATAAMEDLSEFWATVEAPQTAPQKAKVSEREEIRSTPVSVEEGAMPQAVEQRARRVRTAPAPVQPITRVSRPTSTPSQLVQVQEEEPIIPPAPPLLEDEPARISSEVKRRQESKPSIARPIQEEGVLRSGIMIYPRTLTVSEDTPTGKVERVITPPCQGIIIALDDTEDWPKEGTITADVHKALFYKVPCLVSASVLKNVFNRSLVADPGYKKAIIDDLNARKNMEEYSMQEEPEEGSPEEDGEEDYNLIVNAIIRDSFNANEWIIRQIGESLILLLPIKMVTQAGQGQATSDETVFTERELSLGLKIDHQKILNGESLQAFLDSYQKPTQQDYFMKALWHSKKEEASTVIGGSAIFVTGAEYARLNAKQQQPQWTIVITGHGTLGKAIVDLSIEEFKNLLAFLDTKITTKLFIYDTCYAMGTNAQDVFQEAEKIGRERVYQFPIVTLSTYEVPSNANAGYFILADGDLGIAFIDDFANFFETIWSKKYGAEPYDSAQLILPIKPELLYAHYYATQQARFIMQTDKEKERDILETTMNYPHIRPAGRDYFISLFPGIEIGKTMTASRTAPLDVVAASRQKGIQWDRTYVLLRADPPKNEQNISFPLVLRKYGQKFVPFIISATAGDAYHYINKIESDYPITDVIAKMLSFQYETIKIFWINEFIDKSGGGSKVYKNVVVDRGPVEPGKAGEPDESDVAVAYMTDASGKFLSYDYHDDKHVLSGPYEEEKEYYSEFSDRFAFALPQVKAQ